MLLIQLTAFSCGGIAIAVCPSHKIMDGSSLFTFLKVGQPLVVDMAKKCITRRFVFDASKIATLKAKTAGASGQRPPQT
ncbi:deacetylvindoline o-acetyltransferase [Quercus suber]|uniref:Deacetylvindoline o-acetyltransferase n=1 Tax=Quercus suber TaxID=58331 RepID=A0AAW0IWQ8_QUESU